MENLDFSKEEIITSAISKINEHTGLTFLSPGSKARMLIEALSEEIGAQAELLDEALGSNFIRNASGSTLEYIGEIYGVPRDKEKKAEILSEEQNVYMYTQSGTFGDINSGDDIIIPSGSLNIFNTDIAGPGRISYTNTSEIILGKDLSKRYIAVKAKYGGDSYNVGANSLNFHDFYSYSNGLDRSLLISNEQSIVEGQEKESDDNYRFRIQQEKISGEAGNYSSIRLAALMVSGVSDVKTIRYAKGIGTSQWLIKSTAPTVSSSLLYAVQDSIDKKQTEGMLCYADAPRNAGAEMSFSITYKRSLEDSQKNLIKSEIRTQIQSYINNLNIGDSLVLDQIVRIVLSSNNEISSMGDSSSRDNFRFFYIHKRATSESTPLRSSLIRDYSADQDERLILETSIETPIKIYDNN